jgi:hypothetical protein
MEDAIKLFPQPFSPERRSEAVVCARIGINLFISEEKLCLSA